LRQHRAGILQKVVAGIRQRELVCRAPHELCAEQLLELFELAARGRLRNGDDCAAVVSEPVSAIRTNSRISSKASSVFTAGPILFT